MFVVENLTTANATGLGGILSPSPKGVLSKEALAKIGKVQAWAGVYQIVDSVLSGNVVEVKAGVFPQHHLQTLSMTDGKTIYLNSQALAEVTDEMILSMTGVNYHELAHLMFTPRNNSEVVRYSTNSNFLQAFNLLEDNRIEVLLGTMFPSMRVSLTKAILNYLLQSQADLSVSVGKFSLSAGNDNAKHLYHLLHGRKYLPVQLRKAYADLFVSEYGIEFTKAICSVIDRYNKVVYPKDTEVAKQLITEFAGLLGMLPDTTADISAGGMGGDSTSCENSGGDSNSMDQTWANRMLRNYEEIMTCGTDEITPSNSANKDLLQGNCVDRPSMKNGRTATPTQQTQLQEQSDTEFDDYQPTDSGKSDDSSDGGTQDSGKTDESESPMSADELAELLDELNKQIMSNEQASKDIKKVKDVVLDSDLRANGLPDIKRLQAPVDKEYRVMAEQFARELEQLVRLNDPCWLYEQPTGKLNVSRAMQATPDRIDTLFDSWDSGSDSYDIEAVILLDCSGSMKQQIDNASQTAWTIKRGLEAIDGAVTVLTFSDEGKTLYASHEQTNAGVFRKIEVEGNTNPEQALTEAQAILLQSTRNTKLLFIVSDGEWDNVRKCESVIERINEIDGVMTNSVYLLTGWREQAQIEHVQHKCHTATVVKDTKGILDVAKTIIRNLSRVMISH